MQTHKVIPTSSVCTVVIPPANAGYQLQTLSPGQNTYSLIPRKRRTVYCHQLFSSSLSACSTHWNRVVCPLQRSTFPCRKRIHLKLSMICEKTQCRHSDQSVLFSLVRKWLQVRGCYSRTMILRIVRGRRNVVSIVAKI